MTPTVTAAPKAPCCIRSISDVPGQSGRAQPVPLGRRPKSLTRADSTSRDKGPRGGCNLLVCRCCKATCGRAPCNFPTVGNFCIYRDRMPLCGGMRSCGLGRLPAVAFTTKASAGVRNDVTEMEFRSHPRGANGTPFISFTDQFPARPVPGVKDTPRRTSPYCAIRTGEKLVEGFVSVNLSLITTSMFGSAP